MPWRNCLQTWSHLQRSLWIFHIWKENHFLQHFYLGKYDLHLRVQKIFFLFVMHFSCIFETLHNSFLFSFYMTFIYTLFSKEKKNFVVKKDEYIDHLTFPESRLSCICTSSGFESKGIPSLWECMESILIHIPLLWDAIVTGCAWLSGVPIDFFIHRKVKILVPEFSSNLTIIFFQCYSNDKQIGSQHTSNTFLGLQVSVFETILKLLANVMTVYWKHIIRTSVKYWYLNYKQISWQYTDWVYQ